MTKPTTKMLYAVKAIAKDRQDWTHTFWSTLYAMTYEEASAYIGQYGRKIRNYLPAKSEAVDVDCTLEFGEPVILVKNLSEEKL